MIIQGMLKAVTETVTTCVDSIYKNELKLAREIGADNYTQIVQTKLSANERCTLALTECMTTLGKEAMKAWVPVVAEGFEMGKELKAQEFREDLADREEG